MSTALLHIYDPDGALIVYEVEQCLINYHPPHAASNGFSPLLPQPAIGGKVRRAWVYTSWAQRVTRALRALWQEVTR